MNKVLKLKAFRCALDLVDFVNENRIAQDDIQSITIRDFEISYLMWWVWE